MPNMKWLQLNSLQLGRYAEYCAMMEFASYGHKIYSSEVDDHGVDFVTKISGKFYEVQIKSTLKSNYVFMLKKSMDVFDDARLVCYLRFAEDELPEVFVIPAKAWQTPNAILVDRDYAGSQKSKPEWGIQYSIKNRHLLEPYTATKFFEALNQSKAEVSHNG